MGENNQVPNKPLFLKIISGVGRYIFGLIMLLAPVAITLIKGISPTYILLGMLTPPLSFVIAPPMAIGLYFMLSGKMRIRLDITLIILAIICLAAFSGIKPPGN